MSQKTLLTIIIVAVVVGGIWYWDSRTMTEDKPGVSNESLFQLPQITQQHTTAVIQQDLEQIDLGDIDKQFQGIDAELNNL